MSNTVSGIKNMGAPDPIRQPVVMPSKKERKHHACRGMLQIICGFIGTGNKFTICVIDETLFAV